jgi:TctA family transporter
MDDDTLKKLFSEFSPELSSSSLFMAKLEKNMEAVEFVKQHNLALKKRNKQAIAIAIACGFIMGVISTLLYPIVSSWISRLPFHIQLSAMTIDLNYVILIIMAAVCAIISINTYEIAMTRLSPKSNKPLNISL